MTEKKPPYIPALHNLAIAAISADRFQVDVPGIDGAGRKVRGLKFSKTWAVPKQEKVVEQQVDIYQYDRNMIPHFYDEI